MKETNTPPPLRGSADLHGGLGGSIEATGQLGPVPPKPPRRKRLSDLSWKVAEKTLSRPEVQDFVIENGEKVIEWVQNLWTRLQRRKVQPAGQV